MTTTTTADAYATLTAARPYLPAGWTVQRRDEMTHGAELRHVDGARVWVSGARDRGKLTAGVSAPFDLFTSPDAAGDHGERGYRERDAYCDADRRKYPAPDVDRFRLRITFNPARGPEAVARDLARRILPLAIAYHVDGWAAVLAQRAAVDKRAAVIAEILGSNSGATRYGAHALRVDGPGGHCILEVREGGGISIERGSCTTAAAVAIARAMTADQGDLLAALNVGGAGLS